MLKYDHNDPDSAGIIKMGPILGVSVSNLALISWHILLYASFIPLAHLSFLGFYIKIGSANTAHCDACNPLNV